MSNLLGFTLDQLGFYGLLCTTRKFPVHHVSCTGRQALCQCFALCRRMNREAITIASHDRPSTTFTDVCSRLQLSGKYRETLDSRQCPTAEWLWMQHHPSNPITLPRPSSAYRTNRTYTVPYFSVALPYLKLVVIMQLTAHNGQNHAMPLAIATQKCSATFSLQDRTRQTTIKSGIRTGFINTSLRMCSIFC
jgi:hypothetical protein